MKTLRLLTLVQLALCTGFVGPAAADWLVLIDGERIETRGAWRVDGTRVLFTNETGALISLRASQVDIEASREATAAKPVSAQATREAKPKAPKKPVLVLDQSSVGRASAATSASGSTTDEPAAGDTDTQVLRVASWTENGSGSDGLSFSGVLENPSDSFAVLVEVTAVLEAADGSKSNRALATMRAASIGPGETQGFDVVFPNAYAYSTIDFEVKAEMLRSRSDEATDDEAPTPTATDGESGPKSPGSNP